MSDYNNRIVGLLALQGDFQKHHHQIQLIGARAEFVRLPEDLKQVDSLIIPGGETTTMNILIDRLDLRKPLEDFAREKPVYGTCAGMIMLSKKIDENLSGLKPLNIIDIDILRNGYGRQVFSFENEINAQLNGNYVKIPASFIRAPKITRIGKEVDVLAKFNNEPILIKQGKTLASTFHSELEDDTKLLEYFLNHCS